MSEAAHRSGVVPRCWNELLAAQPDAPSVRFRVRLESGADGALRGATVLDPTPPRLLACVQQRLRAAVRTAPPAPATTVVATYAFAAGMLAPVPAGAGSHSPGSIPSAAPTPATPAADDDELRLPLP